VEGVAASVGLGRPSARSMAPSAELRSAGRPRAAVPPWFLPMTRLGLIAGNGKFPFLVLDAARAQGYEVVVAAIKEETFPEIASHGAASVHWLSLGELSKLIDTFKAEGVTRAVMAGQVKHKQIFSAIKPDWRLAKLLLSLGTRNTDSLLGAVAKVLADEGIMLENSTALLEPLLAKTGVLTKRAPASRNARTSNTDAGWGGDWRNTTLGRRW
jgi:UDP-2,3-diacylglucosamine hydrolase